MTRFSKIVGVESFVRFDDFLVDRIFSPLSEFLYSDFSISNIALSRYLCIAAISFNFYGIYFFLSTKNYANVIVDVVLLTILSRVLYTTLREDNTPPGTASLFRHNYYGRFIVFTLNLVTTCLLSSKTFSTPVMSNLLVLIYYFMACDKPRGDRLAAFKTNRNLT